MSGMQQPANVLAVKDAEAAYAKAKKAFDAKKEDAAVKGEYVKATVALGDANMYSTDLDAKVKYRTALKYYREALKTDPANKEAGASKDMIESIYKQMGRPIPEEGG